MTYKILGAGPAGLSAAIKLAQNGRKVEVFEDTLTIGGHTGANVQAIRTYAEDKNILDRFKEEGLEIKKLNPIFKIKKYSPSNRFDLLYSTEHPIFCSFKRGISRDSLENQLALQAEKEGVDIVLGRKARVADVNIIAGGSKFDAVGIGYGAVFSGANFDLDTISFFFGNKQISQGYGYIIPYDKDNLTVAITCFDKSNFDKVKQNFEEFVKTNEIVSEAISGATRVNDFSGSGHFNVPKSAFHKYKYFIGGAAGFVDPARGFGVKYAILSGLLAAKSIISDLNYDDLWKKEFESELIEGYGRRLLLDSLKPLDYEKFVSGEKIPIRNYAKTPKSFMKILWGMKTTLHLNKWRSKFDYDAMMEL
jgi:flavin-dependent dehydrogenase